MKRRKMVGKQLQEIQEIPCNGQQNDKQHTSKGRIGEYGKIVADVNVDEKEEEMGTQKPDDVDYVVNYPTLNKKK